jgi:RNA polymerase sigma-70 factor (ECF subfamily)
MLFPLFSSSNGSDRRPNQTPADSPSDERSARTAANKREAAHDAELVHRFLAGDESAFIEITARYREKIFSVAISLLRNRADAEEIVQDTFIRAYRGLKNFRGDSSLATWLHRIAVNLSRNRYWFFYRRARHNTLSLDCPITDDNSADFSELIATEEPSPARAATATEFSTLVTTCMEQLEPSHREILTLRTILNHSYSEIASALGIEEGTVKSRIARARGRLRSLMAEACPEFSPEADPSEWFEPNRQSGRLVAAP